MRYSDVKKMGGFEPRHDAMSIQEKMKRVFTFIEVTRNEYVG